MTGRWLPDGTHSETGVRRDPGGYDQSGNHISRTTNTKGLRMGFDENKVNRETDGRFGEKTGSAPAVSLSQDYQTIISEYQSSKRRMREAEQGAVEAELRVIGTLSRELVPEARYVTLRYGATSPIEFSDGDGKFILANDAEDALKEALDEAAQEDWVESPDYRVIDLDKLAEDGIIRPR